MFKAIFKIFHVLKKVLILFCFLTDIISANVIIPSLQLQASSLQVMGSGQISNIEKWISMLMRSEYTHNHNIL